MAYYSSQLHRMLCYHNMQQQLGASAEYCDDCNQKLFLGFGRIQEMLKLSKDGMFRVEEMTLPDNFIPNTEKCTC